jgi:dimethylaniline monooxygenase (N-oxide forming)
MMDDQAEWIAAIENQEVGLPDPSEMRAAIERERERISRLYPDSPRYGLELDPAEYRRALKPVMARKR